jgi:hypothetical protein
MNEVKVGTQNNAAKKKRTSDRYALYPRHYPKDISRRLKKWRAEGSIHEVQLLRACLDHLAGILFSQDLVVKEQIAVVNTITRTSLAVASMGRNQPAQSEVSEILNAWNDYARDHEFFPNGELPF